MIPKVEPFAHFGSLEMGFHKRVLGCYTHGCHLVQTGARELENFLLHSFPTCVNPAPFRTPGLTKANLGEGKRALTPLESN